MYNMGWILCDGGMNEGVTVIAAIPLIRKTYKTLFGKGEDECVKSGEQWEKQNIQGVPKKFIPIFQWQLLITWK